MDNFHIDVISEGDRHLESALSLAFDSHHAATHHYLNRDGALVLCWSGTTEMTEFLYPMGLQSSFHFVCGWLDCGAEYGEQPDHDGSNNKGWRVFNEDWGHVDGHWQAICAIAPRWIMYGK